MNLTSLRHSLLPQETRRPVLRIRQYGSVLEVISKKNAIYVLYTEVLSLAEEVLGF